MADDNMTGDWVAVLIPCHYQQHNIGRVVRDFRAVLPNAQIVVADSNSTDATVIIAAEAGARVNREPRQGKGFAIRRLIADIKANCDLTVDGHGTCVAARAPQVVQHALGDRIDIVSGERDRGQGQVAAYRRGHERGNAILTWIFNKLPGDSSPAHHFGDDRRAGPLQPCGSRPTRVPRVPALAYLEYQRRPQARTTWPGGRHGAIRAGSYEAPPLK